MNPVNPSEHLESVQRQFGASAIDYVRSAVHAEGEDLEQLLAWAEGGPDKVLLDVATGGGHTAIAMARVYGRVVASDVTPEMLAGAEQFAQASGAHNITFVSADAQALPFESGSIDAVSCRIAPHHFVDPNTFIREVFRVLKPGGQFLFEDSIVPAGPGGTEFNAIEKLRDPTHVRSLTQHEWIRLIENVGLVVEGTVVDRKHHELEEWMVRSRTPADTRHEVRVRLAGMEPGDRERFGVEVGENGMATAFTDEKLLVRARKP